MQAPITSFRTIPSGAAATTPSPFDGEWAGIVNAPNNGATVQVARLNTSPLPVGASFDFVEIATRA
jgi:hypothetical protein